MRTEKTLRTVLESKQEELKKAKEQLQSADAWLEANDVFATTTQNGTIKVVSKDGLIEEMPARFRADCIAERLDRRERVIRLEEQVKFLIWALQGV